MNNKIIILLVSLALASRSVCGTNKFFEKLFGTHANRVQYATSCVALACSTLFASGSVLSALDNNRLAGPYQALASIGCACLGLLLYNEKIILYNKKNNKEINRYFVLPFCYGLIIRGLHELVFKQIVGANTVYNYLPRLLK